MDFYRSLSTLPPATNTMLSDYDHHMRRLQEIQKNSKHKGEGLEASGFAKDLPKWKQISKAYGHKEQDQDLKKQNKMLLERLWKISEGKNGHQRQHSESQFNVKHRAMSQKKFQEKIIQENRILARNLVEQSRSVKSKRQLKQQMEEYLNMRMRLRKVVLPSEAKHMRQRFKSSQPDFKWSPRPNKSPRRTIGG